MEIATEIKQQGKKARKLQYFHFRISPEMKNGIRVMASASNQSPSQWLRSIVEQRLALSDAA